MCTSRPNRMRPVSVWTAGLLSVALLAIAGGCGGKKKQPEPAPAEPDAPAQPQGSTSTDQPAPEPAEEPGFAFETERVEPLRLPAGVEFPEERRPSDRSLAEAVAQASAAIVSGDGAALASMLDDTARRAFEALQARGLADATLQGVERVRVCAIEQGAEEATIALGVQRADHAVLLSLRAARRDAGWVFQGLTPVVAPIADAVEAFDGVQLAEASLPEPLPEEVLPTDEEEDQQTERRRSGASTTIR